MIAAVILTVWCLCVSSLSSGVKDRQCVEQLSPQWNCNICEFTSRACMKATHTYSLVCVCVCVCDQMRVWQPEWTPAVIDAELQGEFGHFWNRYKWLLHSWARVWWKCVFLMCVWLVTVAVNFTAQKKAWCHSEKPVAQNQWLEICVWFIAKLLEILAVIDVMQSTEVQCGRYWFKIWVWIHWAEFGFCPQLSDEQQEESDCDIQYLPHPATTALTSAWTHR